MIRQIFYNVMSSFYRDQENITPEADKQNEDDLQNVTTTSDLASCDEQSPMKDTLTCSVINRYVS